MVPWQQSFPVPTCQGCGEGLIWQIVDRGTPIVLSRSELREEGIVSSCPSQLTASVGRCSEPQAAAGITFMLGSMDRLVSKSFVVNFYARARVSESSQLFITSIMSILTVIAIDERNRRLQSGHAQHLLGLLYSDLQRPRWAPKTPSLDFEASFWLPNIFYGCGLDHDERTHYLGHQSGDFEFADVRVEGVGAVNLSRVFSS